VLQLLAIDIGTDLLPALALGAEPPSRDALTQPAGTGRLVDRRRRSSRSCRPPRRRTMIM
jgi:magnesium-transporting ATPase (P-type)